ncbi:hypothetical protein BN8_02233 [Fibrisoma limi BUZ 3]|uniref:SatD family (SatD) n=2 Tax=Fibrisoma limi TaxID=663275 RepID=I2GGY6_9BACT|nr:hypothetical protein BN8_02233 [Fibrisoma limi BUZ 3]
MLIIAHYKLIALYCMSTVVSNAQYAVLTGDIVNSSKLNVAERETLLRSLTSLFDKDQEGSENDLKLKVTFEIYRGDSFQSLLDIPQQALRIALIIRTYLQSQVSIDDRLIASDARIAIGIGSVDSVTATLAESNGEAFRFSGRLLDTLKKEPNQIAIKSQQPTLDDEVNTALVLLEGIIGKWTALQAEVVYYKLQNHTEVRIAELLKVKQPAINQRAKAASWVAVERLLARYQELVTP